MDCEEVKKPQPVSHLGTAQQFEVGPVARRLEGGSNSGAVGGGGTRLDAGSNDVGTSTNVHQASFAVAGGAGADPDPAVAARGANPHPPVLAPAGGEGEGPQLHPAPLQGGEQGPPVVGGVAVPNPQNVGGAGRGLLGPVGVARGGSVRGIRGGGRLNGGRRTGRGQRRGGNRSRHHQVGSVNERVVPLGRPPRRMPQNDDQINFVDVVPNYEEEQPANNARDEAEVGIVDDGSNDGKSEGDGGELA